MSSSPLPLQNAPDSGASNAAASPGIARRLYEALLFLFWLAVIAQAFLAGAGIFAGGSWRTAHIVVGHLLSSPLPLIPLLVIVLAYAARLSGYDKGLSLGLFVLTLLQPFWLYLRGIHVLVAAVHPVNALFLAIMPLYMILRVRKR